jgi:hypothetical protein
MESGTFGKWLAERGCRFVTCEDTSGAQGQAYVTVRCGHHQVVLPQIRSKKRLDPRIIKYVIDELGMDWNELPDPASRG